MAPLILLFTRCQIATTAPAQQPAPNPSAEAIANSAMQSTAQTASYPHRFYKLRDQVMFRVSMPIILLDIALDLRTRTMENDSVYCWK